MREIRFCTTNAGKVRELSVLLGPSWRVIQDAGGYVEIQADSLQEVCRFAATELEKRVPRPFLLEDSGLFVDALGGFPGVYSRHALDTLGVRGVLKLMQGVSTRSARFESCLTLVADDHHSFLGSCPGTLLEAERGSGGFGFDPIFSPQGSSRSFAEMSPAEKGAVSHRGKAALELRRHLEGSPPPGKTAKT
ncbi:MAG: RdgB/HAM1 family non-canonical purine NTP pyrophosphatase [Thermoplasmatota archaeon]